MKHIKRFNEGNNLPLGSKKKFAWVDTKSSEYDIQNRMDEIDNEPSVESPETHPHDLYRRSTEKLYKYYVGSVSKPGYPFSHGTFKGFNSRSEVIDYWNKVQPTAIGIRILSPKDWLEIKKIRDQG